MAWNDEKRPARDPRHLMPPHHIKVLPAFLPEVTTYALPGNTIFWKL